MIGYKTELKPILLKLGKHKTGVSCLYINKLKDVDISILKELIEKSYHWMVENYPNGYWQQKSIFSFKVIAWAPGSMLQNIL